MDETSAKGNAFQHEREAVLSEALKLIVGDRNVDYGDPYDDFGMTAELWELYLSRVMDRKSGGFTIEPHDVAVMMVLLKISRLSWTPDKKDHWVDIAGYIGCGWDCITRDNPSLRSTHEPHRI